MASQQNKVNFIGRDEELGRLKDFLSKRSASMLILKGRRRIGKSRLIEEFAKDHTFYSFAGIPPTNKTTTQTERDTFASQLSVQTGIPKIYADDWSSLFILLADKAKSGRVIISFDEISWMGSKDHTFLGKLKNAWDMYFSKNPKLILILCGSVSAWIEKNIENSTGFFGRPSLYMTLDELPLHDCNKFWETTGKGVSAYEKFKVLSVTGGIPRYLEMINPTLPAEENIKKLCFEKGGVLVNEFEHIFSDIFSKRSEIYKKIIMRLVSGNASANELGEVAGLTRTGTLSEYLRELEISGFIAKDYTWSIKTGEISKLGHYRLKDNYIRFYLKYILPNKALIEKGGFTDRTLTSLPAWKTIMGLQFENLVVNNHHALLKQLNVRLEDLVFANPFFQRKTTRQEGCQIDYLVQTRFNTVYICEIKFSQHEVKSKVIADVKEKILRLKLPKNFSYRPVLIHVNGVSEGVIDSGFFSAIIDFSALLT